MRVSVPLRIPSGWPAARAGRPGRSGPPPAGQGRGRQREQNEDAFGSFVDARLFVVADGMGGHNAGEVASVMAIDAIETFFRAYHADPRQVWPYPVDRSLSLAANLLRVGIKVAGGIRQSKQAIQYLVLLHETLGPDWMTPNLFRIGASTLLNDVLMQIQKERTGRYQGPDYFTID
jgi:hypothetical protein